MAAVTRLGLYGGPRAPYVGFAAAAAVVTVTGTAITGGVLEAEIVAGGETIILTVANDTWVAAGTGPIGSTADTQAIIDGITSAAAELLGWNNEVRDKEVVGAVVRDSNTQATITLTAAAAYNITADETITITIPAAALTTASADVIASPTFDVTFTPVVVSDVGLNLGGKGDNAPGRRAVIDEKGKIRYLPVKPTGLPFRKPKTKVDERVQVAQEVAQEVALEAKAEAPVEVLKPIPLMTLSEIDDEIGERLRQKLTDENNRRILLLLTGAL